MSWLCLVLIEWPYIPVITLTKGVSTNYCALAPANGHRNVDACRQAGVRSVAAVFMILASVLLSLSVLRRNFSTQVPNLDAFDISTCLSGRH